MTSIINIDNLFFIAELNIIINNLFKYDNLDDFKGDTIKNINGIKFIIIQAEIVWEKSDNSWVNGDLKEDRDLFSDSLILYTKPRDPSQKGYLDYSLYFYPETLPSYYYDSSQLNVLLRIDLMHSTNYMNQADRYLII